MSLLLLKAIDIVLKVIYNIDGIDGIDKNGNNSLMKMCIHRNKEMAYFLLLLNPKMIYASNTKCHNTVLMYSIINGCKEVSKRIMLSNIVDFGACNDKGNTALIYAIFNDNLEIASLLIKSGRSNPDKITNDGKTALVYLLDIIDNEDNEIRDEYTKLTVELINTGHSNSDYVYKKHTPLTKTISCDFKHYDIIEALIDTGKCKPNYITSDNYCILTYLCKHNYEKLALKLLRGNEKIPERVNYYDKIPLYYACKNNMSEVALLLINELNYRNTTTDSDNEFIYAYKNGMLDVMYALIKHGFNINGSVDDKRNSFLMTIIDERNLEMIDLILDKSYVDLSHSNTNGYNALTIACKNNLSNVAKKIITHRRFTHCYYSKSPSLIYAINNKMEDVLILLLTNKDYKYNCVVDEKRNTPLMLCIKNNMYNIAEIIINLCTSDINAINENGETALIIACKLGLVNLIEMMMQHKNVNILIKDKTGKVALDYVNGLQLREVYHLFWNWKDKITPSIIVKPKLTSYGR